MKAKDMREKPVEDLRELEKSLARDAFQAKLKNFTNRLDDTSQIKKVRRDLARVKTLLGELARKGGKPVPAVTPSTAKLASTRNVAATAATPAAPKSKRPAAGKTTAKKPASKTAKVRSEASK
jgi:large subunit ribosomal protein L29